MRPQLEGRAPVTCSGVGWFREEEEEEVEAVEGGGIERS